jgi:two-component system cell cycle response regulator
MSSSVLDPLAIDPLTGLHRRAFLHARLAEDCDQARILGQALSILALDMDNFGELNDRYLVPGGDRLLAEVARLLLSLARTGDLVVRDGGDQFTLVLYRTDRDEAFREAERIRRAVASAPIQVQFAHHAVEIPVTVSIGVATLATDDTETSGLFVRARQAVHQAKDAGRNRVA